MILILKWHEWTLMFVSCHFQNRRIIYIVKVKRRKTIDAGIIDDVKKKIRAIRKPRGVSIRKGVIYEGELSPAVRRSGYFDALVDIDRLLRD